MFIGILIRIEYILLGWMDYEGCRLFDNKHGGHQSPLHFITITLASVLVI